jgi:alkylation response protein AidB-like acyl-CoA dehydrogenase
MGQASPNRQTKDTERYMRDARITQIHKGTNQILRVVMSRTLLR